MSTISRLGASGVLVLLTCFAPQVMYAAEPVANVAQMPAGIEIDGVKIAILELYQKKSAALFQARNALFDAEKKAASEYVDNYLVEREAKKQGLSVDQLLEKHVYSALPKEPSDETVRFYYDGIDTTQSFESVKDKIRDTVRERRMAKAKAEYIKTLRSRANVAIRLSAPRAPISIVGTYTRGASPAAITLVEFADYECPYCQQIQPVVKRIEEEYKGKIAFAFKDVPLPMHANAQKAAEAARCAGVQGRFWEYHELLFASKQYDVAGLKDHARALKLDEPKFNQCLDSGMQAEPIKADLAEAQAIGLPGTPGFFVNGRFISGAVDYETLRQVIDEELRATAPAPTETALTK